MKSSFIIFCLLFTSAITSQNNSNFTLEYKLLRQKKIDSLEILLNRDHQNSLEKSFIQGEFNLLKYGKIDSILAREIESARPQFRRDSVIKNIHLGKYNLLINEFKDSYGYYKKALAQSTELNDSLFICMSLENIILLTQRIEDQTYLTSQYISDYRRFAPNLVELAYANYSHFYYKSGQTKQIDRDSIEYELDIIKESDCHFCEVRFYQRIAGVLNVLEKKKDSAIYYNQKALVVLETKPSYDYLLQLKKGILNNLGRIHSDLQNQELALSVLERALAIPSMKDRLINDQIILKNISLTHERSGDFKKALYFLGKSNRKAEEFGRYNHSFKIRKLEEEYRNSELLRKNLISEKKSTQRKNLNIILVVSLIVIASLSVLLHQSLKRKQRLAQKEKEILIKNQELSSIDAMVEGQEKERQRIANELHDSLGGLLATLKLYIQNLKIKKNRLDTQHETILKNTDDVLEEAYQKVRSIAQTRNAGVLTSEGLIPTIKNYASKVSTSNSLIVEVEDHGMEKRLSNSLEITVFRMIQELITNVIKHAKASQVIIHITNHENSINLMVEDDGIGFEKSDIGLKDGMGLSSIEKRIESLGGTMDIDTQTNKGAIIIIDIPI